MSYTINTKVSWARTMTELGEEFDKWGVHDWETNYPRGARLEKHYQEEVDRTVTLRYVLRGKKVDLSMSTQSRAVDNLRVLFLAIQSMRMNEKRGIGDILEQAYLQLSAPPKEKTPYEILGIHPDVSLRVAEAVFREMAAKYHPDSKPDGNEEKFKEIRKAIDKIREEKAV